jgi:hypothetical protein
MSEKLHTIREASRNSRMSEGWWRQRIRRNEIRYLKIGNRIFIEDGVLNKLFTVHEPQQAETSHG